VIVLNAYAFVLCLFLYIKGHVNPSGPDSGSLGNAFVDFFWGMELYPRVFDFDLKLFTNCRFGLMAWTILPISYCYKQMDMYGEVSPALLSSTIIQLVYMYKFYLWEMGYMHTMDIQHDRFGYYEGWGCSVWVPIIYTSHSLYFVEHERDISRELAAFIAICGIYSVFVNYEADWQRQTVRSICSRKTVTHTHTHTTFSSFKTGKSTRRTTGSSLFKPLCCFVTRTGQGTKERRESTCDSSKI